MIRPASGPAHPRVGPAPTKGGVEQESAQQDGAQVGAQQRLGGVSHHGVGVQGLAGAALSPGQKRHDREAGAGKGDQPAQLTGLREGGPRPGPAVPLYRQVVPDEDEELVITNQSVSKVEGGSDESKTIDLSESQTRDGGLVGSGPSQEEADSQSHGKH